MKNSDVIRFIERPELLKSENLEQLKQLVNKFPFYQVAHILLLKCLKNSYPNNFNDQLQKSSGRRR